MREDQDDACVLVVPREAAQVQARMYDVMQKHLVEVWRSLNDEHDFDEHLDGLPECDQHEGVHLRIRLRKRPIEVEQLDVVRAS